MNKDNDSHLGMRQSNQSPALSPENKESELQWREAIELLDIYLQLPHSEQASFLADLATQKPQQHWHLQALIKSNDRAHKHHFLQSTSTASDMPKAMLAPGIRLGRYSILSQLGEGGMGEVWLAQRNDGLHEGMAAIKILHSNVTSRGLRDRFRHEARILGKLTHPNIAQLLDAGIADHTTDAEVADQTLYLVLEYVPGVPIDTWCDQQRLCIADRIKLFIKLCEAVAHAHANLVVHRDLKPSNVLITESGQLKLLDFGIGKLVESDQLTQPTQPTEASDLTKVSGRIFTPEYASPEQITGKPVTTATDLFSLGSLLYYLLCGTRPFYGGNSTATEHAVLHLDPTPMSQVVRNASNESLDARGLTSKQLQRELSGDLEFIVTHALRKQPQERYASVASLVDDLRRYLEHQPVLARAGSRSYLLKRFVRRHRVAVLAAAGITLSIITGVAGIFWNANIAKIESARAKAESEKAALEAKKAKAVKDFLLDIFNSNSELHPDGVRARQTTAEQLLDIASTKTLKDEIKDLDTQVELLSTLGQLNHQLRKYQQAESLKRQSVALLNNHLGPDHLRTLNAQLNLGTTLYTQKKRAEAQAIFESVINAHKQSGVDNTVELGRANAQLGFVLHAQGYSKDGKSIAYLLTAVDILEKHAASIYLVEAQSWLTDALAENGQSEEAVKSGKHAIELANAVHGQQSRLAANAHISLAYALIHQEQFDEAEQHIKHGLQIYTFTHGVDSLTTLIGGRVPLADLLINRERYREAAQELQQGLNNYLATHDDQSLTIQRVRLSLAMAQREIGDFAAARKQLTIALATPNLASMPGFAEMFHSLLADVLLESGSAKEALHHIQLVLNADEDQPSEQMKYARILASLGRNTEAKTALSRATQGNASLDKTIDLESSLTHAYIAIQTRHFTDVRNLTMRVIQHLKDIPTTLQWVELETAYRYLATAQEALGQHKESCQSLQAAIKLRSANALATDPRLVKTKSLYAQCR